MGRPSARLGGVAALATLAAGCFWTSPGAGPGRTGHNAFEDEITAETVADLEEVWTSTFGQGSVRGPVTSNGAVHVLAGDGVDAQVYGVDPGTGGELWNTPVDPGAHDEGTVFGRTVSRPIFADDLLWIGSQTDVRTGGPQEPYRLVIELLDPATGDVVDTVPGLAGIVDGVRGNRYVASRPEYVGISQLGGLVIGVGERDDPDAGWSSEIDVVPGHQLPPYAPPTLGNDRVFHAGPGLLPGEGEEDLSRANSLRAYPVEDPDICPWLGPSDLVCPVWTTELDGTNATAPVVAQEASEDAAQVQDAAVYTGTDAGTVHAVDAGTGNILWSSPVGAPVGAEPALADGRLFVPTDDGRLVALDADSGDVLWEATAGDPVRQQPAVAGGVVFTGSTDGTLNAFDATGCDAATCEPLWSDHTGSDISSAPAVSAGHLYVGTTDGLLIAYALP